MNNEWILTDDSCLQYVKHISSDMYSLIEMGLINPETNKYEVYEDTIDVDDYLETMRGELNDILNGFGYKDIEDVINKYYDASQVMAECIFEHYGSFQANQIFIGNESECEKFILDFIKNN